MTVTCTDIKWQCTVQLGQALTVTSGYQLLLLLLLLLPGW
jgi:hypothetical protein